MQRAPPPNSSHSARSSPAKSCGAGSGTRGRARCVCPTTCGKRQHHSRANDAPRGVRPRVLLQCCTQRVRCHARCRTKKDDTKMTLTLRLGWSQLSRSLHFLVRSRKRSAIAAMIAPHAPATCAALGSISELLYIFEKRNSFIQRALRHFCTLFKTSFFLFGHFHSLIRDP